MLKELQEKRAKLKEEANKYKEERNKWNTKASALAGQRETLNDKTKELVEQAQALKERRDGYNQKVSEYKAKRDECNEKAGIIYAKVDSLRKKSKIGEGPSLKELGREIDLLEFKQQTEVLSPDKERQVVDKISALQREFLKKKAQLEQNEEFKALLKKAQKLRDEASAYHEKVTEYANLAQEQHDKMVVVFKEVDRVRAEADAAHMEFVKAQQTADEQHHLFIKTQKEIRDFNKLIASLKKKDQEVKEGEKRAEAKKKAEEVYGQFKKGGKLSTEDLFILQRSDLL